MPNLDFCVDCMDEFRYDDCGGYNPPCACRARCRSCCEARCEQHDAESMRLDDCCDLCGDPWERCRCDGDAITVNKSTPISVQSRNDSKENEMKKAKSRVNAALRQWARGVSFTIAMGRRQVYTLISLDLSRDLIHMKHSLVGREHRHMRDFITSAHCLIDRGLIDAVVWRDPSLKKHTPGKKFSELWRLTRAGELVIELLKESGIYAEVSEELASTDKRSMRLSA